MHRLKTIGITLFIVVLILLDKYILTNVVSQKLLEYFGYKWIVENGLLLDCVNAIILMLIVFLITIILKCRFINYFGELKPKIKHVILSILLAGPFYIFLLALSQKLGVEQFYNQIFVRGIGAVIKFGNIYIVILGFSIFTALLDEILFRGVIYKELESSFGTWVAFFVQCIAYTVAVFNFGQIFISLPLAIVALYIYKRSGSLWNSIIFHAVYNFVPILFTRILKVSMNTINTNLMVVGLGSFVMCAIILVAFRYE